MKLADAEGSFGVKFPERFHEIYETGAMYRLDLTKEEAAAKREEYINDPKAFLMLNCDCEPYRFEELQKAAETLRELISWREEDTKVKLSDKVKLIPFGRSGGGDLYCFLYKDGSDEPMIVEYYHDDYSGPVVKGHDLDEFLYIQMLSAAECDEDIDGEFFLENLRLLNEEYRSRIEGKSTDELIDMLYELPEETADIWE